MARLPRALRASTDSGFGFHISDLGFPVSGFEFRISVFGFRVSGFGFQVAGFEGGLSLGLGPSGCRGAGFHA